MIRVTCLFFEIYPPPEISLEVENFVHWQACIRSVGLEIGQTHVRSQGGSSESWDLHFNPKEKIIKEKTCNLRAVML